MSRTDPRRMDVRRHGAAVAHRDAHPKKKKAAAENGVTIRTERRWGSPKDAKGSPLDHYTQYLEHAQDPWRLLAHNRSTVMRSTLRKLSDREVVDRIQQLHAEDPLQEGIDNANRARRNLSFVERADDTERDAAQDLELAALYRECAARGIGEEEVFGA